MATLLRLHKPDVVTTSLKHVADTSNVNLRASVYPSYGLNIKAVQMQLKVTHKNSPACAQSPLVAKVKEQEWENICIL